ncbi:MAG: MtnX-like HAD-IB family phosphatase [Ignavibacteria bacterium]
MTELNERNFKVFIDFDGTITTQDAGEAFVNTFGEPVKVREIIERWMNNEITSPQSWYLMFDTIKDLNLTEFERFINTISIDSAFKSFALYCNQYHYEIRVLSDGFDFYIKNILKREELDYLEVYCNRAVVSQEKRIIPQFPYGDEECKFCGNCKRNHILVNSNDEDYSIYIGDGYSDKCPVQFCDFVFAKGDLLRYCEINRITYFPFKDFNDVTRRLEELRLKKWLKKKHQAELKRREIYRQG